MSIAPALRQRIADEGPLRLDAWMAACNAAYYAGPDPLGRDFTTAPEISQMFGELVGGAVADLWLRAGRPAVHLVELGPGRGTLMADALRLAARVPGLMESIALHLVETSPALRAAQQARIGHPARWHDRVDTLPADRPLIIIANEFFDALPIRQVRSGRELHVGTDGDGFAPVWQPVDAPDGEWSEAAILIMAALGQRLAAQGGAALIIDYGHSGAGSGDTLQALACGQPVSPFAHPGGHDLTAHVDFAALAQAARATGCTVAGPVGQGAWLHGLGLAARAAALKAGKPLAEAAAISAAEQRLSHPAQMGALFQVLAIAAPGWPLPAGFAMDAP